MKNTRLNIGVKGLRIAAGHFAKGQIEWGMRAQETALAHILPSEMAAIKEELALGKYDADKEILKFITETEEETA